MPRTPKPWFREERQAYFVKINGHRHNLGPDKAEAFRKFHELMAVPPAPPKPKATALTVADVFDKYLDWCQKHRSKRTYEWTRDHVQRFCDHLKKAGTMPADDLRPFHVVEFVDGKATWGSNQKRGAIVAIQRPFSWATKLGYLDRNPVAAVEKPAAQKRESKLTQADFDEVMSHVRDEPFRDLLVFAREAGVRPQEARLIEARHLRLDQHRIEIPPAEAKGKRRWRVIYLSDKALAIVRRLHAVRPSGLLFLNVDGNPWKADAICCRFGRLKKKMGRRFAMYDIRHLFATRKLKEGHDPITVATLLGHKDATMLCKHYEELSRDGDHLRRAVNSA